MALKGTLTTEGLSVTQDGKEIVSAVLSNLEGPERTLWARRILHAPEMAELLIALRANVDDIITEAVSERGGGVTGLARAESDIPLLFQRKKQLDALVPKIGGAA